MVADTYNHRVQLLDVSGRFVHTFGKEGSGSLQLNAPYDVCELNRQFYPSSSASSLLLVADTVDSRVAMWSADGRQAISQIDVGGWVYGVCVDLNGLVYVSVGGGLNVVKIYVHVAMVLLLCCKYWVKKRVMLLVNSMDQQACAWMIPILSWWWINSITVFNSLIDLI